MKMKLLILAGTVGLGLALSPIAYADHHEKGEMEEAKGEMEEAKGEAEEAKGEMEEAKGEMEEAKGEEKTE